MSIKDRIGRFKESLPLFAALILIIICAAVIFSGGF